MSEYFVSTEICPKSREILHHSTITTVRYGCCEKLNPDYKKLPVKLLTRKIIEIKDTSPEATPIFKATRRGDHGQATHVPGISGLKVGNAQKERQSVDQRIAGQKLKLRFVGPIPIVHFQVGVGHLRYNKNDS